MLNYQQEKLMTVQLRISHLHDGVKAKALSRNCNLSFYISLGQGCRIRCCLEMLRKAREQQYTVRQE